MHRFLLRPRWIAFHVAVAIAIVAMVNLGFWQLRRLEERRDLNAAVESRGEMPAEGLDEVLADGPPDDIEWRTATVIGTYLDDEQFVVVNRSQGGRAGENVVTPLDLGDGRTLIVNRGFVTLGAEAPPAPDGEVTVVGRIRQSQERRSGQLTDPAEGDLTAVQRIDIERLAGQLPGTVVPVYVDVLASDPPETPGLPEPVAGPELGEGPHLAYAVQWFVFSACAAIGWVLAVRRSIGANRRRLAAAATADALTSG